AASQQVFAFFVAPRSTDFARVDVGAARTEMAFLDADDDGFHLFTTRVAAGNDPLTTTDLRSVDGRSWTSTDGPSELRSVEAAGTVGGTRVVVGEGASGSVVARNDGAGGWVVSPLSSLV